CMADNGLNTKVFGIIWDGTGLGDDHTIWGGEFLEGDYESCRRVGSIRPIPLPGADQAIREIGRIGAALLWDAGLKLQAAPLPEEKLKAVSVMLDHHIACPNASSMGRLFDGAASLLLGLNQITF